MVDQAKIKKVAATAKVNFADLAAVIDAIVKEQMAANAEHAVKTGNAEPVITPKREVRI